MSWFHSEIRWVDISDVLQAIGIHEDEPDWYLEKEKKDNHLPVLSLGGCNQYGTFLERCNWEVAASEFSSDDMGTSVFHHENKFLLLCDPADLSPVLRRGEEMAEALEGYPILCETTYSEKEFNSVMDQFGDWGIEEYHSLVRKFVEREFDEEFSEKILEMLEDCNFGEFQDYLLDHYQDHCEWETSDGYHGDLEVYFNFETAIENLDLEDFYDYLVKFENKKKEEEDAKKQAFSDTWKNILGWIPQVFNRQLPLWDRSELPLWSEDSPFYRGYKTEEIEKLRSQSFRPLELDMSSDAPGAPILGDSNSWARPLELD